MIVSIEPFDQKIILDLKAEGIDVVVVERNAQTVNALRKMNPEVLICRDRDNIRTIVERCPTIKLIFIVEVGVEELPFEILLEKGIRVANTGGISTDIMSNYVMSIILGQCSRLKENVLNQQSRYWKKFQCTESLQGKVMLVVGAGHTGRAIARKAKVFGMAMYGVQREPRPTEFFDKTMTISEMDGYLAMADYVVCTLPETKYTVGLFNYQRFTKMKPTATFINVSRGALVVEEDLLKALDENLLSCACLDVFRHEPLMQESPLWTHPNVIVTPHQSGRLSDYMIQAMKFFKVNYWAFKNGERLPNEINLRNGY